MTGMGSDAEFVSGTFQYGLLCQGRPKIEVVNVNGKLTVGLTAAA